MPDWNSDKFILERYAYYYEVIQEVGKKGQSPSVRIKQLSPSRGMLQRAYREMKSIDFNGKFQGYMRFISVLFILFLIRKHGHDDHNSLVSFVEKLASLFPEDARNFRRTDISWRIFSICQYLDVTREEARRLDNIFYRIL